MKHIKQVVTALHAGESAFSLIALDVLGGADTTAYMAEGVKLFAAIGKQDGIDTTGALRNWMNDVAGCNTFRQYVGLCSKLHAAGLLDVVVESGASVRAAREMLTGAKPTSVKRLTAAAERDALRAAMLEIAQATSIEAAHRIARRAAHIA